MKSRLIALAASLSLFFACAGSELSENQKDPVDYVNPLVGSESTFAFSSGNTYPAVAMPWGLNFWTPQTGPDGNGWTYQYNSNTIRGIKQTHQPSPWINDYAAFSLMPVTTGPIYDEEKRASWFSHKAEIATPYYYQVYLADHDVVAEVTPTERAASFRFTYPEKDMSYLVLDAYKGKAELKVDTEGNTISGYISSNSGDVPENFKNWFIIESDTPFTFVQTVDNDKVSDSHEVVSDRAFAIVGFPTSRGQVANFRVASSFISLDQAKHNLEEIGDRSFDEVKRTGRARWNEILGRIRVEGGTEKQMRTFYSCLYRSLLFPRDFTEIDSEGNTMHYSAYNGKVLPGNMTTDTGFWDTFRSLFPLLNLVYPDYSQKVQEGLVNAYLESGFLPEWASPGHKPCMIGNNSASVVADAWLNGVRGQDAETLWKAVVHDAHAVHPRIQSTGRHGWQYYDSLGYVPCNVGIYESAAKTLEYSYDDWCIYKFGETLGKSEEELAQYKKAALNYRNLYDPEYRLMVGKNVDGIFSRPFNPLKWGGDFTEGNSLHYTWSVFHDPQGLIDLMGGDVAFSRMMDTVFSIPPHFDDSYYGFPIHEIREMQVMNRGNYAHGNQPIQHFVYLYNWCGQPWKAQFRARDIMKNFYTPEPDGYCGDEDNGQTSAWYVFSAMGMYPVCPGSGQYAIGSPLFKKVTVDLPSGKSFVIQAPDNSDSNVYIKSMKLNGKFIERTYLTHEELSSGAEIVYDMTSEPETTRGTAKEDRPYSFSNELK